MYYVLKVPSIEEKDMTLTVTLELSPEMEAKLREGLGRGDAEKVRQLLMDALGPTVEALLQQTIDYVGNDEFEAIADQLADELAACVEPARLRCRMQR
jgi:hypothetical protein